jgi:hypothetical protein
MLLIRHAPTYPGSRAPGRPDNNGIGHWKTSIGPIDEAADAGKIMCAWTWEESSPPNHAIQLVEACGDDGDFNRCMPATSGIRRVSAAGLKIQGPNDNALFIRVTQAHGGLVD